MLRSDRDLQRWSQAAVSFRPWVLAFWGLWWSLHSFPGAVIESQHPLRALVVQGAVPSQLALAECHCVMFHTFLMIFCLQASNWKGARSLAWRFGGWSLATEDQPQSPGTVSTSTQDHRFIRVVKTDILQGPCIWGCHGLFLATWGREVNASGQHQCHRPCNSRPVLEGAGIPTCLTFHQKDMLGSKEMV